MVFGAKDGLYILLLKWVFRSFVPCSAGVCTQKISQKPPGLRRLFLKFFPAFCKKPLHFFAGYGMLNVMRLLLSQRLNRFRPSIHCPPSKAQF